MQNFKNRLYNYEAKPPVEIWDKIATELERNNSKVLPMRGLRKRSKLFFYGLTAAASLIIIFISSLVFNKSGENTGFDSSLNKQQQDNVAIQNDKDSVYLNNKTLKAIIQSSKDKNLLAKNDNPLLKTKKYITIEGPEGKPVKISSKAATLIVSADNEYPPKPVWSKKIEKWKQIMLSSTFSPTSASLLDITHLSPGADTNE